MELKSDTRPKKSRPLIILAVVAAAILSLCCCLPGIINLIYPIPYTSTMTIFEQTTTSGGTLPSWAGIFCLCAALIPWVVILIVALARRPKKEPSSEIGKKAG
jgi:hypothetical protein